jgi:hypothetical protein
MKRFTQWITASPASMRYVMIIGFGCMLYFILQKLHHRDGVSEFEIYYNASGAFLEGKPLYGQVFNGTTGTYTYAPFTAILFSVFHLFPYSFAISIYYFLVLAGYMLFTLSLVYFLEKEYQLVPKNRGWLLFLITAFMFDHFERELHIGNVNVFLLIMAFWVFFLMRRDRPVYSGIVLGMMMLFEPYTLIIWPYFLYRRNYWMVFSGLMTFAVGLVFPAFFHGLSNNLTLIHQWFDVLLSPGVPLVDSPNTLYGIYHQWVLNPLHLAAGNWLLIAVWIVVATSLFYFFRKNKLTSTQPWTDFAEYALIVSLVPHLVHTDTDHFMWTWPLVTLGFILLQYVHGISKRMLYTLLCVAFIPLVMNSPDIVGRKIMLLFDEGGLLGLGNLLLVGCSVYLIARFSKSGVQLERA